MDQWQRCAVVIRLSTRYTGVISVLNRILTSQAFSVTVLTTATYFHLGEGGADDLMRTLYETLIPAEIRRDPIHNLVEYFEIV